MKQQYDFTHFKWFSNPFQLLLMLEVLKTQQRSTIEDLVRRRALHCLLHSLQHCQAGQGSPCPLTHVTNRHSSKCLTPWKSKWKIVVCIAKQNMNSVAPLVIKDRIRRNALQTFRFSASTACGNQRMPTDHGHLQIYVLIYWHYMHVYIIHIFFSIYRKRHLFPNLDEEHIQNMCRKPMEPLILMEISWCPLDLSIDQPNDIFIHRLWCTISFNHWQWKLRLMVCMNWECLFWIILIDGWTFLGIP